MASVLPDTESECCGVVPGYADVVCGDGSELVGEAGMLVGSVAEGLALAVASVD